MKAAIIKFPTKNGGGEVPGWILDETEGLFAIDQRVEADLLSAPPTPAVWAITHIPSGFRVSYGPYTEAGTQYDAFAIALRFYREAKARGWDMAATEPAKFTAKYKTMSKEEVKAFWLAVADWKTGAQS